MCVSRIVGPPVLVMHGACIEWIECPSPSLLPLVYLLAYPTVSSSTIPRSLCWSSLYSLFLSRPRFRIPTKMMHSQIPSFLPSAIFPCHHAEIIPGLKAPVALLCSALPFSSPPKAFNASKNNLHLELSVYVRACLVPWSPTS